ncbi:MAG: nicotinamide-nucleotide amidohydrolase family protein [Rhizobiaceae bacterium]|nr:nicotinamide-nucleotide amidohydrolase family protein [Rhizobiaceae bacterium]
MIADLSQSIIERGTELNIHVATAESCTGGLIAGALTEIAGSSAVVDRGFVTYSNEAKNELLNVPMDVIADKGAVSATVARAMVAGALANSRAQIAVAVTGIAGPGGGTETKPVGLVYIAVQSLDGLANVKECKFADQGATTRGQVREMTVQTALEMLLAEIG